MLTHNFDAVKSYNPANTYALAVCHLGDRIRGEGPFVQPFPGGERSPTLVEVQEIQRRLTELGFNTDGTDGRVGKDTMKAIRDFQVKAGMMPADGYAELKVLARFRRQRRDFNAGLATYLKQRHRGDHKDGHPTSIVHVVAVTSSRRRSHPEACNHAGARYKARPVTSPTMLTRLRA